MKTKHAGFQEEIIEKTPDEHQEEVSLRIKLAASATGEELDAIIAKHFGCGPVLSRQEARIIFVDQMIASLQL